MTNVQALVQSATVPNTDLSELWDIYQGYANRSRKERKAMKRALAQVKDETLLDVRSLFALPEAWHENNLPVVAISPIWLKEIGFTNWNDREGAGFHSVKQGFHSLREHHIIHFEKPIKRVWTNTHKTLVPAVPKSVMPWNPLTRRKLFVLFDADWKALPVDPYLLERVNDNQFRIVGHWDISDKERQLMALMGNYIA